MPSILVEYKSDLFPPRSSATISYTIPANQVEIIYTTIYETIFKKLQTLTITSNLIQRLKIELRGRSIIASDDPLIGCIRLFERFNRHREIVSQQKFHEQIEEIKVEEVKDALVASFHNLTFSVYAMGTIPKEWTPILFLN